MTVPPDRDGPPEQPQNPYGYQPPYGAGPRHEQPRKRNYGLIGGIIVGITILVLGAALLVVLGINQGGDDSENDVAGEETTTGAEETTTPEEETEPAESENPEVGQCLPFDPEVAEDGAGEGLELLASCDDPEAFWVITEQSYDVDAAVDDEGKLTDNQPAYDLCGEEYGTIELGEAWQEWHWVYSFNEVDSMYCYEALGNPDDAGRTPYTPDTGSCFDDSEKWWTVPCDSDLALYEVVDTVEFDEPEELSDDEAAEAATCGGELFWEITDVEGRTTAILCADEV